MIEGYFGPQVKLHWDQSVNRRPYKYDIQGNENLAERERKSKPSDRFRGKWDIHDMDLSDYSRTFREAMLMPLKELLVSTAEQKKADQKPNILDLMASEAVVREALTLGFGYGLAVSLGFPLDPNSTPEGTVAETVNGDLIVQKTWLDIKERMTTNNVENFDVIFCRPEGGLMCITNSLAIHFELLQRAWRILNPDNGHLLFQIPFGTYHYANGYFDELGKVTGLDVVCESPFNNQHGVSGYLHKTKLAPKILPTPKMLGME